MNELIQMGPINPLRQRQVISRHIILEAEALA